MHYLHIFCSVNFSFPVSAGSSADKIFISCGAEVRGYTKKGKLFLALETNLSEPIIAM